jgi:WD40 repeat protein
MKLKYLSSLILLFVFLNAGCENESAAPGTEVYLFDLEQTERGYIISNPINISDNPGYDNQPSFSSDGEFILFASSREGQTDVRKYDLRTQSHSWLTDTEGSEYSPTLMPDGQHFSAINLKPDGEQLLWKYPLDGSSEAQILVLALKIGYHSWFNQDSLISFVLGDSLKPATLQLNDLIHAENTELAINPGRSLHRIPESERFPHHISYLAKSSDGLSIISALNMKTGKTSGITAAVPGSEDMAWTPSSHILMGDGAVIKAYFPDKPMGWVETADLNEFGLTGITRIAVSPKGDKIAVVVNE